MVRGSYTTQTVSQITGFSVRQLDYWAGQGIVIPSIQRSHGPGTRRLYSFDDLVCLGLIRHLKQQGWSTQKIRLAISQLKIVMDDPNPLRSAILVPGNGTVLAMFKSREGQQILLDALNSGGQQVMDIVLDVLEEETRSVIEMFGSRLQGNNSVHLSAETDTTRIDESEQGERLDAGVKQF